LIDRLEELVDGGTRIPISNRVAIDEDAFLNIVDQMRITIPQEIKEARDVREEREKHIAQAQQEARRIIAQAREDVAKQLDEHSVKAEAEDQARKVIAQAESEAEEIRGGADRYAEAQLTALGQHVEQLMRVIANGLEAIDQRRSASQIVAAKGGEPTKRPKTVRRAPSVKPSPNLGIE